LVLSSRQCLQEGPWDRLIFFVLSMFSVKSRRHGSSFFLCVNCKKSHLQQTGPTHATSNLLAPCRVCTWLVPSMLVVYRVGTWLVGLYHWRGTSRGPRLLINIQMRVVGYSVLVLIYIVTLLCWTYFITIANTATSLRTRS
jgi:ribosomal protein S27E